MTTLDAYYTSSELENFTTNFRKFIRLTSLIEDPLQTKWVSDEYDLESALKSVADMFHSTKDMIGKRKHRGIDYNFTGEVKLDMIELLLRRETELETSLQRKRYLPLYYLIVEPAIDLMDKFSHVDALANVDDVMQQLAAMVYSMDHYGSYEDALVAQLQVKQLIQQREEQQKLEKNKRKRKRKPIEIEIIDDPIDE